ncbi:ABC transporter ATP-binding protein [Anaerobaca lacustris]|uniref:ABC transporter ATP-binding protein n=1 Tax=Anaerobaca lacustris TaxID=3044600 RepID=A0AAW6TVV6_9BACT|nr:ABC transporter ATP-binding protein [Sedimentisphaerales bacterium M17dextr]
MAILEAQEIRKEFGPLVAVNDVSLSVDEGDVLGLIGPNGAGKSTLLRMFGTLLRPTAGRAQLVGRDLTKDYLHIRKHVGFLPDFFNLYSDLTLGECLRFFAEAYGVPRSAIAARVEEVLSYIELADKRDSFIRHLSRGMVQRVGLGMLLVHDPQLFLLDEPASGLDPKARIQLRNILRKLSAEGKTVIISSHILTELSGFCSHVAIMNRGRIELSGAVDEIRRKVTGSMQVEVSVLGDPEQAVAMIRRFPLVSVVGVDRATISVEMVGGPQELAGLNAHLVHGGIEVVRFAERKTDLEDLFMKISGDAP